MSRTVSATALQAMLSQETGEVFLTLVEINHAGLASPLRFVNNTELVVSNGDTYSPAAFEFRLPSDQEDNVPQGEIMLDNVDRQIIEAVRPLGTAPTIEVNIILASSPNTIEIGPMSFKLKQFDYNAQTIRGRLGYDEDFLNEGYPKDSFNPRTAQGLF